MNQTRLTCALFIMAAAVLPALLVSFTEAEQSAMVQVSPAAMMDGGVKVLGRGPDRPRRPWEGEQRASDAKPIESDQPAINAKPDDPRMKAITPLPGVAVVELFTSEGCSSCPPAEKLIPQLVADATKRKQNAYFLVFHVDYWDRLGWKDVFADPAYTARQHAYAKVFGAGNVYTPQTVVNGSVGFVGSDRVKSASAIDTAQHRGAEARIEIKSAKWPGEAGEPVRVEVSATRADGSSLAAGTLACFALVEDGLVSNITAGENKGETLRHDRVVRAFKSVPLGEGGAATAELSPQSGARVEKMSLIAFVQDGRTMRVLGAAEQKPRK